MVQVRTKSILLIFSCFFFFTLKWPSAYMISFEIAYSIKLPVMIQFSTKYILNIPIDPV